MIAVFSDIHGNLPALEACHADALARGCNQFLNLGDILSGPLWPRETAEWLMARDWPTIAGNHERQLLTQSPAEMGASDAHAIAELDQRHLDWLAEMPPTLDWRSDLYLCHGTPASDLHYLFHRVEPAGLRDCSEAELAEQLAGIEASVVGCGHSHMPIKRTLSAGRQAFNPGSVGLPAYEWDWPYPHRMELGSTHARYAVLNGAGKGLEIDLVAVEYDHERAAAQAEKNGRMDWAVPLRTGLVD